MNRFKNFCRNYLHSGFFLILICVIVSGFLLSGCELSPNGYKTETENPMEVEDVIMSIENWMFENRNQDKFTISIADIDTLNQKLHGFVMGEFMYEDILVDISCGFTVSAKYEIISWAFWKPKTPDLDKMPDELIDEFEEFITDLPNRVYSALSQL
ncbi:MAG: hypothetical protein K8S56_01620 [Candidatus Cloacimonetes bacterium]|nr:hypothetical protein [Candidatus Cloacimonadota bacterium]